MKYFVLLLVLCVLAAIAVKPNRSGSRFSRLQLSARQEEVPHTIYGPPPEEQYGPPSITTGAPENATTTTEQPSTTTESESETLPPSNSTQKINGTRISNKGRRGKQGVYYIYHPDGLLQKVLYSTKADAKKMAYTTQVRYEDVEPIREPIYTYDPQNLVLTPLQP